MATTTRLTRGQSKPEDSPEYSWIEASYDGKGDSELVSIPNHWYKVCVDLLNITNNGFGSVMSGSALMSTQLRITMKS